MAPEDLRDVVRAFREYCGIFMEMDGPPGLNVAIANAGGLVDHFSAGFSDLFSAEPSTPDDIYYLATTTKPMTATIAVALTTLQGRDRLRRSLGRTLHPLFRDLGLFMPLMFAITESGRMVEESDGHMVGAAGHITLETTLRHRSGIAQHSVWQEPERRRPDNFLDACLDADPGTTEALIRENLFSQHAPYNGDLARQRMHYGNVGYVKLGYALEKVTGASFADLIRVLIADPIRRHVPRSLDHFVLSGQFPRGPEEDQLVRNHWRPWPSQPHLPLLPYNIEARGGAAGCYGTVTSLALFAAMLLEDNRVWDRPGGWSNSRALVNRVALGALLDARYDPGETTGYGLGF